ncbi:MAG TPA: c-type cytochrome [Methylibium sp.]|uniref:c-type cytochrome n=1 Tax=Methylibium sp. TaxID=2067992 RepID=UPI002DBD827F|nr:c-type cytochrome [Methylibium sp.]HEU4458061.1 c-type cytochrome [Methylibium sp.]
MSARIANWIMLALAATAPLAAAPAAAAAGGEELARNRRCLGCHVVEGRKVVGPSFKDVAARYAGHKGAEAMLAKKIREGGAGNWGPVPMTANTQVSEAEAKQLVGWILGLN